MLFWSNSKYNVHVIKTNSSGNLYDNVIKGQVFKDDDLNCEQDVGELGLSQNLVQILGSDTTYAFTNNLGEYEIGLDTGSYGIRSILPNPYWELVLMSLFFLKSMKHQIL